MDYGVETTLSFTAAVRPSSDEGWDIPEFCTRHAGDFLHKLPLDCSARKHPNLGRFFSQLTVRMMDIR